MLFLLCKSLQQRVERPQQLIFLGGIMKLTAILFASLFAFAAQANDPHAAAPATTAAPATAEAPKAEVKAEATKEVKAEKATKKAKKGKKKAAEAAEAAAAPETK